MPIDIRYLTGVVYSAGKVFDGLSTSRLDTRNFLASGDTSGVTSRHDLSLLLDLRAAAEFILAEGAHRPMDASLVKDINARMTRSASIRPGELRPPDQDIGVSTVYGRHAPPALTTDELEDLLVGIPVASLEDRAIELFIALAKAQPFWDGNKRTGIFAANCLLVHATEPQVLTIPVDDRDPTVADTFCRALARAYIDDDHAPVTSLLRAGLSRPDADPAAGAGRTS